MHRSSTKTHGFTLIEVLVVTAIIGLLASIIMASFKEARKRSRDVTRVQNIVTLRTVLELYNSTYGHYPQTFIPPAAFVAWGECERAPIPAHPDDYIPGVAPEFIPHLPSDPSLNCTGTTHSWFYASDGADYKLITHIEADYFPAFTDPAWDNGTNPCILDGTAKTHYGAWTHGARCWAF